MHLYINLCTLIFCNFHKSPESKCDLAIKMSRSIQCHYKNTCILGQKSSKLSIKSSYVLEYSHFWSCCKIGQGQPKIIICTIMVVLQYPMLHINFQGNDSIHWFERRFVKVFTMNRHRCNVVSCDLDYILMKLFSLSPRRLYMKFCDNWSRGLRRCLKL